MYCIACLLYLNNIGRKSGDGDGSASCDPKFKFAFSYDDFLVSISYYVGLFSCLIHNMPSILLNFV